MKTILLLDDDAGVITLLRRVLKEYALIEATTAEEALRLFADRCHKLDLLLADLSLPISSGLRVALLLRSETPKLPIILISGYPVESWSDRDLGDLEKLGSELVIILQKPFDPQGVSNAVRELIGSPPVFAAN